MDEYNLNFFFHLILFLVLEKYIIFKKLPQALNNRKPRFRTIAHAYSRNKMGIIECQLLWLECWKT